MQRRSSRSRSPVPIEEAPNDRRLLLDMSPHPSMSNLVDAESSILPGGPQQPRLRRRSYPRGTRSRATTSAYGGVHTEQRQNMRSHPTPFSSSSLLSALSLLFHFCFPSLLGASILRFSAWLQKGEFFLFAGDSFMDSFLFLPFCAIRSTIW